MIETGEHNRDFGADRFGFSGLAAVHWNLGAPQLYEFALQNGEARTMITAAHNADRHKPSDAEVCCRSGHAINRFTRSSRDAASRRNRGRKI